MRAVAVVLAGAVGIMPAALGHNGGGVWHIRGESGHIRASLGKTPPPPKRRVTLLFPGAEEGNPPFSGDLPEVSAKPRPSATRATRSLVRRPLPAPTHVAVVRRSSPAAVVGCTYATWRSTVSSSEAWIIEHEHGVPSLSVLSTYTATHDPNPTSDAFGMGQLLLETRRDFSRGIPLDTTDPCLQLVVMRRYIADRYGSASAAEAFWREHSWY